MSTDDLIARARQQTQGIADPSTRERLIIDLADALESARAEVAERIAQAIEAERGEVLSEWWRDGIDRAARIAREAGRA